MNTRGRETTAPVDIMIHSVRSLFMCPPKRSIKLCFRMLETASRSTA